MPAENLLGEEGKGFHVAMDTLHGGRIGIAAQALGIAEGAFERAPGYAKEASNSTGGSASSRRFSSGWPTCTPGSRPASC